MAAEFKFDCHTCGRTHEGFPSFGWDYPINCLYIPAEERDRRIDLGTDECVIDGEEFYVRGCLDIPVIGMSEPFVWGVWVSLSRKSFEKFVRFYEAEGRENEGPFFGWLCSVPPGYPDTEFLKTMVHLRPVPARPRIELEPTDHPLAVEQRNGITVERVKEIAQMILHPAERRTDDDT